MWHLKNIKFKNLFSYEEMEYKFRNNTCTLIVGENRDNGGNNGAGKSTIFEAISLALTNKSLRDLKKESFINRDSEDCLIKLDLFNDVLKSKLSITRQFFRGNKPAKVEVVENGEVDSTLVSVDEANKRILELIGISRDDLLRYFIISQDNKYTFFTAGDVEKKEVLNRITSADMINPILEKLSENKKKNDSLKSEINDDIVSLSSKKETLEEQLQEILEEDNSEEIEDLQRKIKSAEAKKKDCLEEQESIKSQIDSLKKKIDSIEVPDVSELRKKKKNLRNKVEEVEDTRSENNRIERIAKSDLDSSTVCPECGAKFLKDSELKMSVEETEDIIQSISKENKKLDKKLEGLRSEIKTIDEEINDANELQEEKDLSESKLKKLTIKFKSFQDDIASFDSRIRKYTSSIKELEEQKKNNAAINSLKTKIENCSVELEKRNKDAAEVEEELNMINYWIYYMGKSGFITFVANRAVSVLEGTVNSFLRKFKSDLSVNINGFKILRDGSVREKIEVFALENGMNAEAFMSKSGGERGRINLAGVLAIQHLINMSSSGKGINILMLDESFAGIDSEGQESIIRILENLGITVLMITQNVSSEFNNDNKVLIIKENGVSRLA